MRWGRGRGVVALAVAVCSLLALATGSATPAPAAESAAESPTPPAPPPLLEPVAETLLEVAPHTRALKLAAAATRSINLCAGPGLLDRLDELGEPLPHDYEELHEWAVDYHRLTTTYDPQSKVRDPNSKNERYVEPPLDVLYAIETQRAAVYAYKMRLEVAKALRTENLIDDAAVRRRLDDAFEQLVRSPFTSADRYLEYERARYCR